MTAEPTHLESHGLRRMALIILGVSAVIAIMLLSFATPSVNSGAKELPLAVSGPAGATEQIVTAIDSQSTGTFDITKYGSVDDGAEAIRDRDAIGGIAATPSGVTIQIASGAGTPYPNLLRGIGDELEAAGQTVTYDELAPLTDDDPTAAGISALALPLVSGGMASGAALMFAYRGSAWARLGGAVALAGAIGLLASAILRFVLGTIDGSFLPVAAAIAFGVAAISLLVLGAGLAVGKIGVPLVAITMLLVSNPLAGLATGPAWLPQPWGDVGQFMPLGAAGTAIRSIAYFDGAGATQAWLVLTAWVLAGLLLGAVGGARNRRKGGFHAVTELADAP